MYKIEVLPVAKKDIDDIIFYISHNLKNITASKKLRDLFINSFEQILQFPYGASIYQPPGPLQKEYRIYRVKNFLMFYTIDEKENLIIIVRVLYNKMDVNKILIQ